MAIRNVKIKELIFLLSKLNLEHEYVDMGYDPNIGLILVPVIRLAIPPKKKLEEEKLKMIIDPDIDPDSLLG